jgi:hypothetical protein
VQLLLVSAALAIRQEESNWKYSCRLPSPYLCCPPGCPIMSWAGAHALVPAGTPAQATATAQATL